MTDQTYQLVDAAIVPRIAGPTKFIRLPSVSSSAGLGIALVGIPWDGGTTNRAGARHGSREIRSQSSLMRREVSVFLRKNWCRLGDSNT
jgi:guanidinopropionase